MAKRRRSFISKADGPERDAERLLGDLREMIEAARLRAATAANIELTLLYWRIGRRIHSEVLSGERARYGGAIVATLSQQLVAEYGRGFAEKNLRRMVQFAESFPDQEIVVTLSRQLSWSHFLAIIPLTLPLQREYYNCKLKRLVAMELKVGEFRPEYKGQMEIYLRWLDRHEREPGEETPLGIILCAGKKTEQIELLELDQSGIHVAEYLTALPPRELLSERLQLAAQRARRQLEHRVPPGTNDRAITQESTRSAGLDRRKSVRKKVRGSS